MEETKTCLLAGFAKACITPSIGMDIPGYYAGRYSTGVVSDLFVRCVAFQLGKKTTLLFSCDAISFRNLGYHQLKKLISEKTGVDEDALYMCCTHSHTSFRLIAPEQTQTEQDRAYMERLFWQFCDVAQLALQDLKPATLRFAKGEAPHIGFIRRYRMKDGTVKTNPALSDPNILSFEGEHDDSLQLLRVMREGDEEIVLINFGTHADVVGGTKYSADYSGFMIDTLQGALKGNKNFIFFNGAEGDSNHRNAFLPKGTVMKGVEFSQKMGRKLAGEVLKIYDDATEIPVHCIEYATTEVKIPKNYYKEEDVPIALEMCRIFEEKGKAATELTDGTFALPFPAAMRIVSTMDLPKYFDMTISGVRLGNVLWVGIPGEPFQRIGLDIKTYSPAEETLVTSCTNGGEENAYYPTPEAYQVEGYEKNASLFAPECSLIIHEGVKAVIAKLFPKA